MCVTISIPLRSGAAYPDAWDKWSRASQLLWAADSNRQLTTIGHLCPEAVQDFAQQLAIAQQSPV